MASKDGRHEVAFKSPVEEALDQAEPMPRDARPAKTREEAKKIIALGSGSNSQFIYDPYGDRAKLSGSLDADFQFGGYYFHFPSSLSLTLMRAYSASLARWISRDPIAERGGTNLYAYVSNAPINLADPFGTQATGAGDKKKCNTLPPQWPFNGQPLPNSWPRWPARNVPPHHWWPDKPHWPRTDANPGDPRGPIPPIPPVGWDNLGNYSPWSGYPWDNGIWWNPGTWSWGFNSSGWPSWDWTWDPWNAIPPGYPGNENPPPPMQDPSQPWPGIYPNPPVVPKPIV